MYPIILFRTVYPNLYQILSRIVEGVSPCIEAERHKVAS